MGEAGSDLKFDYVVIGSGFGGSVSALRLAEKGYRVLVLEKGKEFKKGDYPKTNWNLRRWLWLPALRLFGFFKITMFRHLTILSGVGVGGGSLVYANTLPRPKTTFFQAPTWSHLADWEEELKPFYPVAEAMLGTTRNPQLETGDLALQELARETDREKHFGPTNVAVFFGEPEVTVRDPYFGGLGPERTGCNFCGACMVGCQYDAKNTLDKNYLFFARRAGAEIRSQSEVFDVAPIDGYAGATGYRVRWKSSTALLGKVRYQTTTRGVVFAGGVLGTIPLLLKLKKSSLPRLSDMVGRSIRTNSESLSGVMTFDPETVFSDGVAIGSILHTDAFSHLEPVRYPSGSGFWRLMMAPMVQGRNIFSRFFKILWDLIRHPILNLKALFVRDWAKKTQILLYMRTLDSTLRFSLGRLGMKSSMEEGPAPTAFMPEAKELAERYGEIVNGKPYVLLSESLLGIPTTAHILGGAVMGQDASEGVMDRDNRVFGYTNMLVCDGSMISANPGVNPSLTICALSERAMKLVPQRADENAWEQVPEP